MFFLSLFSFKKKVEPVLSFLWWFQWQFVSVFLAGIVCISYKFALQQINNENRSVCTHLTYLYGIFQKLKLKDVALYEAIIRMEDKFNVKILLEFPLFCKRQYKICCAMVFFQKKLQLAINDTSNVLWIILLGWI